MKKILVLASLIAFVGQSYAQDAVLKNSETVLDVTDLVSYSDSSKNVVAWPAFFAVGEIPETPDLIGLRLTIPCSTKQESVTGIDVGFWSRTLYFEGVAISLLRNDVKDQLSGAQIGIYNSAPQADAFGVQVGFWNEVGSLNGIQVGLVNAVGSMDGIQVGVINRAEDLYGFQVGAINVIRNSEVRFLPIVNIGF